MRTRSRWWSIGNGMAGARLVEDVIARDPGAFDIIMFGDEPYGNYNRILLSGVLAGTHDPKDIFINPLAWYEHASVTLHAGVGAARIDRAERSRHRHRRPGRALRRARHRDGQHARSSRRSTACGTTAARYRDGVFVFRTLDDCAAIRNYAAGRRRAAVIGGGLLGLEAARGLRQLDVEVHVVHLMRHLMDVQLDEIAGEMLRAAMERLGVTTHLSRRTTRRARRHVSHRV